MQKTLDQTVSFQGERRLAGASREARRGEQEQRMEGTRRQGSGLLGSQDEGPAWEQNNQIAVRRTRNVFSRKFCAANRIGGRKGILAESFF